MSDTVLVVLIIAITVVVVLYLFRRQLSDFLIKANKDGLEAHLKTRGTEEIETSTGERPGVQISGSRLIGKKNEIEVRRDDVRVDDSLLLGQEQKISVKPDRKSTKKKKK